MAKAKSQFQCNDCGAETPKWVGQCPECMAWNTLIEVPVKIKSAANNNRFKEHLAMPSEVCSLGQVNEDEAPREMTGLSELDRVMGGGLVKGSVTLIGGDPGIGKSTLLLQTLSSLHSNSAIPSLYITGEESAQQISLRGKRLGLPLEPLRILTENNLGRLMSVVTQEKPGIIVIDSIQTIHSDVLQSAPGAVAQVRECAAQLVRFAKQTNTAVFLVGHVTKDGALAGPKVLEHMVDTVLYFEGDSGSRFRVIRAVKNRYGAVNELGIFAMTDKGLREVSNPSAIFLTRQEEEVSGSIVMVTREGTRPMLVEVQALVDDSKLANPRRVTLGLEQNRLAMLLAVLHRHAGVTTADQDVFVNVVGGVKISETGADMAILLAILSSLRDKPLSRELVVFGEVGLAGEVRPVQNGPERLKEAAKHGFKIAAIPAANKSGPDIQGLKVKTINRVTDIMELFDL